MEGCVLIARTALLVIPLVYQLREMDFELRYHHPYVILFRGGATASESLLLDYVRHLALLIPFHSDFMSRR
jgi:hypothetical protein